MKLSHIIAIALCLSASARLAAQPLGNNSAKPEVMLKVAETRMGEKDYYNALDWYEKYYEKTKDKSIAYKIAETELSIRDYVKAETWFARAIDYERKTKKTEIHPDILFSYARVLKMNEKYDDAIIALQDYMAVATDSVKLILAKNELLGAKMTYALKDNPRLTVEPLGNKINTTNAEYSPSFSDGTLYFTAYRNKAGLIVLDGKEGDYHAKVYESKKIEKTWSEAKPLSDFINRPGADQGNVSISPDGKVMYFTRTALNGNVLSESKIYYSTKGADGAWGAANEVKGVNGNFIAKQPCLGELYGKDVLFFVSNMPGSQANDIYYATRIDDGSFDLPVNIGAPVNTVGDEETPFYRDGKLYFSSTGHPGIGGFDVFVSTWNGTNFSQPKNLGKGYNSPADDLYFTMDNNGNGFVVSNRVGTKSLKSKTCCDDIFGVNLEPIKIDLSAIALEGSKNLKGVDFQLVEMTGGSPGKTDRQTVDTYAADLDLNKSYLVIANKKGYYPDTARFNTVNLTQSTTIEKKLNLKPVPPPVVVVPPPVKPKPKIRTVTRNERIKIDNIYYPYDDYHIVYEDAKKALDYIKNIMDQYPTIVIELGSHTDSRGNDDYNMKLSQRRADAARSYLLEKGIAAERIKAQGYGETQILNRCKNGVKCTDEEHQENRRTEFKIISGPTEIQITEQTKE